MSVKDGDADSGDDDNNDEQRQYKKSMPNEWTMHVDGNMGQSIDQIPFHGDDKFLLKVMEEELRGFMHEGGDVCFHRIEEWMLPKFGDGKTFYECLATRMNYMTHCIAMKNWVPKYYAPMDEKYITASHVAWFFNVSLLKVCKVTLQLRDAGQHGSHLTQLVRAWRACQGTC